jgi:hypothetical protein
MDKPLVYSKVNHSNKEYNEDNISPTSAMTLIQFTLPGPSASNAGGSFILDDFILKFPTT